MAIRLEEDPQNWDQAIIRVAFNAIIHPFEYAKLLIQIGHEPLPAYKSKNIFGKDKFFYPSIFSYIAHIKHTDGLGGCYRGVVPSVISKVMGGVTCQQVGELLPPKIEKDDDNETDSERLVRFLHNTLRESVARCAGIVVSHPLQVVATRAMAQFVGQEQLYGNMFASLWGIGKDEGFSGLFAGLGPRLLCDMGCVWMGGALIYAVNSYVLEDKETKIYMSAGLKFIVSSLWYPLHVVSSCMVVTGTSIAAGQPPNMAVFSSWRDCYSHLAARNCLKRGSSLFWRTYTGPALLTLAGQPTIPNPDLFMSFKPSAF